MFQINHIFFLDTKKNMVIDGKFTKIVYSDSVVSLNGLYIYCPLESDQTRPATLSPTELVVKRLSAPSQNVPIKPPTNYVGSIVPIPPTLGSTSIVTKKIPFIFSLLNPTNIYLIKELNRIEHEIIEHYKEFFQIHKTNVYSLRNQLKSGNIKVVHKIPYLFGDYESINVSTDIGVDNGIGRRASVPCSLLGTAEGGVKFRPSVADPTTNSEGDRRSPGEFGQRSSESVRPIVVKISGIWETNINIGITFKFQI
jgi:hypothetical protein